MNVTSRRLAFMSRAYQVAVRLPCQAAASAAAKTALLGSLVPSGLT